VRIIAKKYPMVRHLLNVVGRNMVIRIEMSHISKILNKKKKKQKKEFIQMSGSPLLILDFNLQAYAHLSQYIKRVLYLCLGCTLDTIG